MPCMCGDSECPSCGRAQGTYTGEYDNLLVPGRVGSKKHLKLIKLGWRTHHADGPAVWLEKPKSEVMPTP